MPISKASDDIDCRNKDRRHRIALIEAGRSIHCAVELRLASHCLAPFSRRDFIDKAGIQIGIDGHLLSRQCIQSETGRDFRRAHGAVTDHQELDGDQREKQDKANDVITTHDELAKRLNDTAGRPGSLASMEQDATA